jgi:hypothetical protein
MSHLSVNTISPSTTPEVQIQGANPPTYLGSELAQKSDTVLKTGSTMTGPLVLSGNASLNLHAVPKQQLDTALINFDNNSYNVNGWQRFPNGFTMMWGVYTPDISTVDLATSEVVITFPTMTGMGSGGFPTGCYHVQVTTRDPSNDNTADSWAQVKSFNQTTVTVTGQNAGAAGTGFLMHGFFWLAIGS